MRCANNVKVTYLHGPLILNCFVKHIFNILYRPTWIDNPYGPYGFGICKGNFGIIKNMLSVKKNGWCKKKKSYNTQGCGPFSL